MDRSRRAAPDRIERQFIADAPNRIWVADIAYVPTWNGFVFLAIVLDVFSRKVVGWAMANHLRTELVLAALNMAIEQRHPQGVIHHSVSGTQYTSLAFGKRCREMGVVTSTGSAGDCYALAESIIGLYETEVIRTQGPWRGLEAVEVATLDWVDWFNNRRILEPIGDRPPAEAEAAYYRQTEHTALAA